MSSFHRKYGPTRSPSIGCGMLSLIIAKPTSAPVWASCTAHGWGIARCSWSASAKISSIELRYWSWPGPRRRPRTAARSPELTMSRSRTLAIAASFLRSPHVYSQAAPGATIALPEGGKAARRWPGYGADRPRSRGTYFDAARLSVCGRRGVDAEGCLRGGQFQERGDFAEDLRDAVTSQVSLIRPV